MRFNHYRTYTLDESYFDELGPNQAYILGLLYANGCHSSSANCITLALVEKDKELLEKINVELGSNRPLKQRQSKCLRKDGKTFCSPLYALSISSKKMSARLLGLGLVPAKSLILTYPSFLSTDLHRHFIRGYVDGDGSVQKAALRIVSTEMFCTKLAEIFDTILGVTATIHKQAHVTTTTRCLRIHGLENLQCVYFWLYHDAPLAMQRKQQAASETLKLTAANRRRSPKSKPRFLPVID